MGQPPTLYAEVWGCKFRAQADCWRVWGLDVQRTPVLGGLQGADVGTPHQPGQVPWGTASQVRRDLSETVIEVCCTILFMRLPVARIEVHLC